MREGEGGLASAIQDILLGFALSIPLEIAGSIVFNNPQLGYLWTTSDLILIIGYKFLLIMVAVAIIEVLGHWGLMYTLGYMVGALLMSIILGFEILNFIMILIAIFVALLVTVVRIVWRRQQ
ncbi:MAG: hypothetical protein QXO54_00335 [Candidatus Methanomethylicaceae archaeon]